MPSATTISSTDKTARRALVTGAAGFIGANLTRRLVADGHDVHCLVRPGSDGWRLAAIAGEAEVSEIDLNDSRSLLEYLAESQPQWVFHLAAHGAYSWQTDVSRIVATNLGATVTLGEACAKSDACEALVNAGSSSEYGYVRHPPAETEVPQPNSHYAVGKVAATLYLRFLAQRTGFRTTTLRLYSVYGPWEEPNRLIPKLAVEGLMGRLPRLADPNTARDFVYVDDVCEAFVRAARSGGNKPGEVFNVGSGTQVTLREAVDIAIEQLPIERDPEFGTMEPRDWDTNVWVADPGLIKQQLGWQAGTSFAAGFSRFTRWLQSEAPAERYGLGS